MPKALVKNWGYGETEDIKTGRCRVRYVGHGNISQFIKGILGGDNRGAFWIRDRMGETANDFELALIAKYPNAVVKYNEGTHEVLQVVTF
jgi:hypothetical protein